MPTRLPLLALLLLSPLLVASAAHAQPLMLVRLDSGELTCQGLDECDSAATSCASGAGTCSRFGTITDRTFCGNGVDTFLCCSSDGMGSADADCMIDGVSGRCIMDLGPSVSAMVPGVCIFGEGTEAPTFCVDDSVPAKEWIERCLTTPAGEPTSNWSDGDCDGDHATNAEDLRCGGVCDPTNTPTAGMMGCGPDAGATDGGLGVDGSIDGGAVDAGTPDTGRGDAVGGDGSSGLGDSDSSDPTNFRGAGGCACDATRGTSPGSDLLFWGLMLLAFTTSRRAGRGS